MKNIEQIKKRLGADWNEFEQLVSDALNSDNDLLNTINSHVLGHSGKKLRPLLALLVARAYPGGAFRKAAVCAAVSEIMHTATLLHDDVADNSDMRRGVPTVRSLFSPGASVLVGDYWLSKAIHLLINSRCDYDILMNFSSTIEDLARGEMLQMQRAQDLHTTEADYYEIIKCKTASLFISTIVNSALMSGFPQDVVSMFGDYAYNLGISFQIRDDIIDYQPSSVTGKDTDSDIAERKITLPLLGALKSCPSLQESILQELDHIDIMKGPQDSENSAHIRNVRNFVLSNGGLEYAAGRLSEHVEKAKAALKELPESDAKSDLISLVSSLAIA